MSGQKKSGDSLVRVCTWFLGAMSLLTVCTTAALGQESQPDPPAMSEPKSVTQKKVDNPAEESTTSTKKRRILSKVGPPADDPGGRLPVGPAVLSGPCVVVEKFQLCCETPFFVKPVCGLPAGAGCQCRGYRCFCVCHFSCEYTDRAWQPVVRPQLSAQYR